MPNCTLIRYLPNAERKSGGLTSEPDMVTKSDHTCIWAHICHPTERKEVSRGYFYMFLKFLTPLSCGRTTETAHGHARHLYVNSPSCIVKSSSIWQNILFFRFSVRHSRSCLFSLQTGQYMIYRLNASCPACENALQQGLERFARTYSIF